MMGIEARLTKCELDNGNLMIEVKYFDGESEIETSDFLIADNLLAAEQFKQEVAAKVKGMEAKLAQTPLSNIKAGDVIASAMLKEG